MTLFNHAPDTGDFAVPADVRSRAAIKVWLFRTALVVLAYALTFLSYDLLGG
jgi:hypothetical protein